VFTRIPALAVLLVLSTASLSAQTVTAIDSGTRVRVNARPAAMRSVVGRVQWLRGDSMAIRADGADTNTVIPTVRVDRLQVSQGQRRQALSGLGRGVMYGGGAGALLGLLIAPEKDSFIVFTRGEQALLLGTVFGLAGGAIGLVTGSLQKAEGWKTVPRPAGRVQVTAFPSRGGTALRARLTF
jgi:hypothetical protein